MISPLEPLTPDDFVLLLVVLPSAEHGVAPRHRTRTRRPADTEEMAIVENVYQSATKVLYDLKFLSPGQGVNIWHQKAMAGEDTQSYAMPKAVGRSAKGSCCITAVMRDHALDKYSVLPELHLFIDKLNALPRITHTRATRNAC